MDETRYHQLSEEYINKLSECLEKKDEEGLLDVEYQDGMLTIIMPSEKQLLVSKHVVSRQIWLSSPISGGLHFSYKNENWCLEDGRTLADQLASELKQLAQIDIVFS